MDVILRDILVFLQSGNIWRHVLDLIDIGLVAFFLYRLFLLVRGTQAVQLMFGVLLLARGVLRIGDHAPERDGERDRQQLETEVAEQDRYLTEARG